MSDSVEIKEEKIIQETEGKSSDESVIEKPKKKSDYVMTDARKKAFEQARLKRQENIDKRNKEKEEFEKIKNEKKEKKQQKEIKKKEKELKELETSDDESVVIVKKKQKPKK